MTSHARVDLLGLGISPVDLFISMDIHPAAGLKIDGVPGSSLIAGGGPVPNALCTFARMGGTAAIITSFGDDHWAEVLREGLNRFGIWHEHCLVRKDCSSALASAWININTGERTIVLDMDPRLYIKPRDIITGRLPVPKLVLVDGRHVEADLKLVRWAKTVGSKVMLDIGSVRNRVDDIFPYLDFLVCADNYAFHHFNTRSIVKAAREFKSTGIPEVVVTSGVKGSFGIDPEGGEVRQQAYKVDTVDATGAGDVYHGAYLFGLHKGWNLARKMRFASAAAALKCRKPGAREGIPGYRQTLTFMKHHMDFYD